MDHHCPWVNNCAFPDSTSAALPTKLTNDPFCPGVGHQNLKYFFLFLVYGACLGTLYLAMFGFRIFDMVKHVRAHKRECCKE